MGDETSTAAKGGTKTAGNDPAKALDATAGAQPPVGEGGGGGPTGDGTTVPAAGAAQGDPVSLHPAPAAAAVDHGAISKTILESPEFAEAVRAAVEKRLGSAETRAATKAADERAEADDKARRERVKAEEKFAKQQREADDRAAEDRLKAKKAMTELFEKVAKTRRESGGAVPAGEGLAMPGQMATLLLDDGYTRRTPASRSAMATF